MNALLGMILFAACFTQTLCGQARACVRCNFSWPISCWQVDTDGAIACHVEDEKCVPAGKCYVAGCFLAGTIVETPNGPREIEQIQVGDAVLGVDEFGSQVFNRVLDLTRAIAVTYYVINGDIEVTGSHPFLVGERWVTAEELRVGDVLTSTSGASLLVASISSLDWGVRTFNLSVSGTRTFFADGVLVHNKDVPGEE